MGTFSESEVGDVVKLVQTVEGVVKEVPAIITKLYKDAHSTIVADLHLLESHVFAAVGKEDATDDVSGKVGLHVVSKTTPDDPPPVTEPVTAPVIAPVMDADTPAVTAAESAYASMSPEDQAAFAAFLASKGAPPAAGDAAAVPIATSSSADTTTG